MKAQISIFLLAAALVLTATNAEARVVQKEQSWFDKIFSNDSDEMIQKSPFSQPQKRAQNPRLRNQPETEYSNTEEARTQSVKEPEPRQKRGSRYAQKDREDRGKKHLQTQRQKHLNASRQQQTVNVND